ncbi:hypothetical protein BKG83_16180 [Mycobacteroides chelonae]|nr:hypothetical protein [Mycobacteroides chelonae]OHU55751.1 hypothetical protein BKG83_16180 [Mycobacteroides chelonae]
MPFHPEPVEASSDFYTRAPIVLVGCSEFDVSVDTLWETVESFEWMPFITAPWKPTAAPGLGSRRRLSLGPLLISTEFVTHIDSGKEIAFYLEELPIPGIRAVAEKLTLTDLGHDRSALTYRIAVAPKLFPDVHLRLVAALARPIFSAVIRFGWTYGLRKLRQVNS